MANLAGRGAVITGGGRGVGAATARALARAGTRVLVAARSRDQIEQVAAELRAQGHVAHAAVCDIASEASVDDLHRMATDHLGEIDILVNNAGVADSANIRELTLERWNRIMTVNATGTYLVTQAFVTPMLQRGWGRIVNVASVTSRVGTPYISAYTASKHAVLGFTRSLAAELRHKGVTVNCLCPGYINTEMTAQSVANLVQRKGLDSATALQAILETVQQPRLIEPEEVAHLVVALCHPHAGGTTGQAIVMDAGGFIG